MRVMMRVQIPVDAGNTAIANGDLPKVIQGFGDAAKPEALYFTVMDGKRTMIAVFDLTATSDIPRLAEPFFNTLKASLDWMPCMDAADLQAGLSQI